MTYTTSTVRAAWAATGAAALLALGACAGLGAVKVLLSHFSVMVRDQSQVFAAGQEFKLQTLVDWQQQGPGHEFRVFGPKGTTELDLSFHDAGDPNHITGPQGQASLYVNQVMIWPPFHAWQASAGSSTSTGTASDSGLLTATDEQDVIIEEEEIRIVPARAQGGGKSRPAAVAPGNGGGRPAAAGKPGGKGKGKDKGGKEKPADSGRGERPAREQKPREGTAREQQRPAPRAAADRAPDEFLDDDIDNFGNRVDYVPQQKPAQGRGRRPGAPAQGAGAGGGARTGQSQGRQSNPRNSSGGASTGTPAAKRNGPRSGAARDGQGGRREDSRNRRPARDDQSRQEPAVQNPRGGPAPKIIHKESKSDRFPTPEQLDQLPSRPRGEKPALLTRNR